jgi:hypothetical protein
MSDIGDDVLKNYSGKASFTAGTDTSITVGMSNTYTAGASVTGTLGGQATFTYPMNLTFSKGTYLTSVWGSNVTWTNGDTMGLSYGNSVSYALSTIQQARNSYEIKAGLLPPLDGATDAAIEAAILSAKQLMVALFVVSAAVSAGGAATDLTMDVGKQDAAANWSRFGANVLTAAAAAGTSFVVSSKLASAVADLARLYSYLSQISRLTLSDSEAVLQRVSPLGAPNYMASTIRMNDLGLTVQRAPLLPAGVGANTTLTFNDAGIKLAYSLEPDSTTLYLGGSSATLTNTTQSLIVSTTKAVLQAGEAAVTVQPTSIGIKTAPTTSINQTVDSINVQAGQASLYLWGQTATLEVGDNQVFISDLGVAHRGELIQLG